jgi:hypothetical protein
MIPSIGYGADRTEIDLSNREHAVQFGGDAGKQLHSRPAWAVDVPVVGEHPRLLEAVIERVAVEELDVTDPDRHAPLPCGGPPGLEAPGAAAGTRPPGATTSASS